MKRFVLPPEPPAFDQEVRRPGNLWLEQNPGKRPPDRWTPYRPALAEGFLNLCAYTAMFDAGSPERSFPGPGRLIRVPGCNCPGRELIDPGAHIEVFPAGID